MSHLTFNGEQYKTDELLRDTVALARNLAQNARLYQPLPVDTDLSDAEVKQVQDQVNFPTRSSYRCHV